MDGSLARETEDWWAENGAPSVEPRLKGGSTWATVALMHEATGYRRPQPRRGPSRAARRARRRAILLLVGLGVLVVLAFAAFRSDGSHIVGMSPPASSSRLLEALTPPTGLVLASTGGLQISSPVNERVITAIGYHGAGDDALALDPVGRQANEGLFARVFHRVFGGGGGGVAYYQLGGGSGPSTGALDIGAAPATDVYSPVDGTVVGLRDYVLNGQKYGSVIDIQPTREPSVVLSVSHVEADPALTVGSTLARSTSKIGRIVDFSGVEHLALARFTRDAGDYAEIVVRPAGSAPAS